MSEGSHKSNSRRSWWKVAAAYAVAVPVITALIIAAGKSPLFGLVCFPVGAFIVLRWAP